MHTKRKSEKSSCGIMSNRVLPCLLGAAMLGAGQVLGATVTLGPSETLNWSTSAPASGDVVSATGGTIVFPSNATVDNEFQLGGEVAVDIAEGAAVRFRKKFLQTAAGGRLVLSRGASFGGTSESSPAFLDGSSVAFAESAPAGSALTLMGYVSLDELPETYGLPVVYDSGVTFSYYGYNMTQGTAYTVPSDCTIRFTSPTNFPVGTTVTVPPSSKLIYRPMSFNAATGSGSGLESGNRYGYNDIVLDGGTFEIYSSSTIYYMGDFTGTGTILKGDRDCWGNTYFRGDMTGMSADSKIWLRRGRNTNTSAEPTAKHSLVRIASSFPGTVEFETRDEAGYRDIISFGFNAYNPADPTKSGSGSTNEVWTLGAIKGAAHIYSNSAAGARLQYSAKQKICAATLSGKLAVYATSVLGAANMDELEIGAVADDTELWIQNGLKLTFGSVGKNVKLIFLETPVNPSTITVGEGTIGEIRFLGSSVQAQPVTLNGDVDLISGKGKVVVSGGEHAVGYVDAGATLDVQGGTVTMDDGELFGALPALWFDASDLTTFDPLYKSDYHQNANARNAGIVDPSYLLGESKPANTYTNAFPLIEKWYDKRPAQRAKFFWNDRWPHKASNLADGFYPQFYPFVIPNGLNGRPVLSFGAYNYSPLNPAWAQSGDPKATSYHSEQRRMHLMESEHVGHAVYVSTCVAVYNSANGGGYAVLGGYSGNSNSPIGTDNPSCQDNFARGGTQTTNPIFSRAHPTWVNGESVDPTTTPMSGSWDILSFNGNPTGGSTAFRNIGGSYGNQKNEQSGGMDYAELLVYTNTLSDAQRRIVEQRLANKWGLASKQSVAAGSVTVAADARVVGWRPNVTGTGTCEMSAGSVVYLDGSFAGRVTGAGEIHVTANALSFAYADGAFASTYLAPDADLTFPSAVTVTVTTGGARVPPGDYAFVSGKSLAGLTECTLVHDIPGRARLVRTDTALVLRVLKSGLVVIFR